MFFSLLFVMYRARGVYYVTTNAKPPYARGFPGKGRSNGAGYSGLKKQQ